VCLAPLKGEVMQGPSAGMALEQRSSVVVSDQGAMWSNEIEKTPGRIRHILWRSLLRHARAERPRERRQQGSQILGTPSSGRPRGVRRCSMSCVGLASGPGFSISRSHGGRSSNVGCRWPTGAGSTTSCARDDPVVAITLASKDGSPIAWATWLNIIVASKGTIIIDDRICMAYCASVSRSDLHRIIGGPDAARVPRNFSRAGTPGSVVDPSPLVLDTR
jgi:hypothetical protein